MVLNMNELNAKNCNTTGIKSNTRDNDRKRWNSTINDNKRNKYSKSKYYAPLDTIDDFECEQDTLMQFTQQVSAKANNITNITIPNLNVKILTEKNNNK